ncbi:hypothetical protein Trydic_g21109 [Trypoxylus dichotomus]
MSHLATEADCKHNGGKLESISGRSVPKDPGRETSENNVAKTSIIDDGLLYSLVALESFPGILIGVAAATAKCVVTVAVVVAGAVPKPRAVHLHNVEETPENSGEDIRFNDSNLSATNAFTQHPTLVLLLPSLVIVLGALGDSFRAPYIKIGARYTRTLTHNLSRWSLRKEENRWERRGRATRTPSREERDHIRSEVKEEAWRDGL